MTDVVRVEGLAELRRTLRRAQHLDALKELQQGLKGAADIVAQDAKRRASAFSRRAASTVRAGASGNKAYVAGGKSALPWYGWADFGSRTPVQGNPRSVGPWAHSGRGPVRGRFIYPAFDAKGPAVAEKVADAVDAVFRKVG